MSDQEIGMGVLLATLIILLFAAGIIIITIRGRHEKARQQVEMSKMQLAYQTEILNTQAEIAEQLRSDFAREMHDNIGQLLTFLYMQIENKKDERPELRETLQPLTGTVSMVTEQVQLLSRALNTDYIGRQGLRGAITTEITRLKKLRQPQVHFSDDDLALPFDKNQELIVFRIFQEAVNNALKHSGATDIFIELHGGEHAGVMVRDNGKGFSAGEVTTSARASGLANMSKRASMAGLRFDIISETGKGCTCTIAADKTISY